MQFGQDLLDQVVASHGDAAGHDQQVGLQTFFDQLAQAARFVGSDGQEYGFAAGLLNLHGERIGVGVADLRGAGFGVDFDDFVAGGEHGDARTNEHLQPRSADRGRECDGGFVEARAAVEQEAAAFGFGSLRDDVFSWGDASCYFDGVALRDVYSTITTASAPCGTGAPVMME